MRAWYWMELATEMPEALYVGWPDAVTVML
jgi:hypothetical protein